jgi:RNA polymerase sigma-70 factor (ECF subfamily)
MSHSLGSQPGNSRLESNKEPEPTGKRLRRFVFGLSRCHQPVQPATKTGVSLFPVHAARSIPPTGRHRGTTVLKRPSLSSPASLTLVTENSHASPPQVLHCLPLTGTQGKLLQFHSFDEAYVERLRAGDFRTQEHFGAYFSELIQVKMRSRLQSREAVEDVRQETFARFFAALRDGKILHPERLGSFVNSVCNNVLLEHYRENARETSLDDDNQKELPGCTTDLSDALVAKEMEEKVREVLEQLSERDRRLLREVFLEERDKDDVCRDFGVDREYLRVLLHRAKQSFKSVYLKNNDSPEFTPA